MALVASGLGLPDRDYYTQTDEKSARIREQYAAYIQQLLSLAGESPDKTKTDAAAILKIETNLAVASLTRVELRDPHSSYHMQTLAELQTLVPSIDWSTYFKVQGVPDVPRLNVSQPAFMKAVEAELTTESVPALRAYLRFHLLSAAAPHLAQPFVQSNFDFYSKTLRGVPAMPPRWKTCTRAVDRNLGEALDGIRPPHLLRGHKGEDAAHDS